MPSLSHAEWHAEVPEDRVAHGTVDMAITTMNRQDFCAKLIGQLADDGAAPLPRHRLRDGKAANR
jgi:galactofuranosylgalactofuranosylrhamnosyl-N-acetylglucosaminyl-diphospho-decaprenol beta-1,5/1,6-galactofuranosyltransferase